MVIELYECFIFLRFTTGTIGWSFGHKPVCFDYTLGYRQGVCSYSFIVKFTDNLIMYFLNATVLAKTRHVRTKTESNFIAAF